VACDVVGCPGVAERALAAVEREVCHLGRREKDIGIEEVSGPREANAARASACAFDVNRHLRARVERTRSGRVEQIVSRREVEDRLLYVVPGRAGYLSERRGILVGGPRRMDGCGVVGRAVAGGAEIADIDHFGKAVGERARCRRSRGCRGVGRVVGRGQCRPVARGVPTGDFAFAARHARQRTRTGLGDRQLHRPVQFLGEALVDHHTAVERRFDDRRIQVASERQVGVLGRRRPPPNGQSRAVGRGVVDRRGDHGQRTAAVTSGPCERVVHVLDPRDLGAIGVRVGGDNVGIGQEGKGDRELYLAAVAGVDALGFGR